MHVEQLSLTNFRNLATQDLAFPARVSVIVGRNGQGKTNLLESIYFLAQAKSFRVSAARELISWRAVERGIEVSAVEARVRTSDGVKEVSCRIAGGNREVYINQNRVRNVQEFYGQVRVVEFTPDDLQLVKGGPAERRRFIDRLLAMFDRRFVPHAVAYERALRQRNALLRDARSGGSDEELRSWNELLIRHGLAVATRRYEAVQQLAPLAALAYEQLVPMAREQAQIAYSGDFFRDNQLISHEAGVALFNEVEATDRRTARTSRGVHRDDILIALDTGSGARPAKFSASQGQARSLALALKLAAVTCLERETGDTPIILLDDIESELDATRRDALFRLVRSSTSQVIITSTEVSPEIRANLSEARILGVISGVVAEVARDRESSA